MKIAPEIRTLLLAMLFVLTRSAASAQALPTPWVTRDIGNPAVSGSATYASGRFTITAAGSDIWGSSDQFRFVYQPVTGDLEIVAQVVSITRAHGWSKAGVMIRESLSADSRHALMTASAANGYGFQRRPETAGPSLHTTGSDGLPPAWVRLVRAGDLFTGYESTDGVNWRLVGSDTVQMGDTIYVGLAVTSHNVSATTTATIESVKVTPKNTLPNNPPAVSITAPLSNTQYPIPASIGITANATDAEGEMLSVDFYANQTLISRDTTAPYSATFSTSTAGTYSLTAVAHDADGNSTTSGAVPVTVKAPANQVPTVSLTSPAGGASFTAPASIDLAANASDPENQLTRVDFLSGTTVVGSDTTAPYSFSWTNVAAGTYSLTAKAYDAAGGTATSTATSVTVTAAAGGLSNGMIATDVGSPAIAGRTTYASSTYTIDGAGRDIWESSDEFHFVYQSMSGDLEVVARVKSLTNTDGWAKAGVMIRETLAANSRHAMAVITPANGYSFQRRLEPAGDSFDTTTFSGAAPGWLRLTRTGNTFRGYWSADGVSWTLIGSDTVTMNAKVFVGMPVTSHNATAAVRAVIDNFRVQGSGNGAPSVALTAPADGATFMTPATISLTATASDPENQLAGVEFYSGTTLLGTDTTAPYSVSWGNVAPGTYSLTARAYDAAGASATSVAATVTVGSANAPPTAALTSPSSGATFTAPATINLTANASDPEHQLVRVEFFSGSTLLGTDTTSPYSFSWTNVAAGTYSLTAKAYDAAGASATSTVVNVTVSAPPAGGLPAGQTTVDIGSPAVAGRATYASGTYTIDGAGRDIWDTSDQFQFVYQSMSGDVEVVARIGSLTNTDEWAKAGVMIRETLAANSRHAMAVLTPGNGYSFQRRLQTAGLSSHTTVASGAAPGWVRLVRIGSALHAYSSANGVTWTLIGSDTVTMGATVFVGLAVTSHHTSASARAVIDNFRLQPSSGNGAPSVTLTAPTNGATFTAPATITLTANASDPEHQLARVEFYSGTTLLGTDTTAPYSFSWTNGAAGTYSLKAKAYDTAGASATSAAATVTVSGTTSTAPSSVVFTASADHATNVTSYKLSVYTEGDDPTTAMPVATSDLGKPAPGANNDITVNRATFFSALAPGNYVAIVTAIGPGGQTPSAPPVPFTR